MPVAFDNLAIADHYETLKYTTIKRGGYQPQLQRFTLSDYVYLQQIASTTLDVTAGRIILRIKKVLSSGVLELEGRDERIWKDHSRNCSPCHLPNIDGIVDPNLSMIPPSLKCMLCGRAQEAATMTLCNVFSTGWHMRCLTPPLDQIPSRQWICPRCKRRSGES